MLGVGTSSFQVEGHIEHADWSDWVRVKGHVRGGHVPDVGCHHFETYRDDIRIIAELGIQAFRFSVEWSRVEPEKGCFDTKALAHYRDVAAWCRKMGVEPLVTLHHFTLPKWLAAEGGVLAPSFPEVFCRYAQKVVSALGEVFSYTTFNEPVALSVMSYLEGVWPPGKKSLRLTFQAIRALIRAHRLAYGKIKERTAVPVGINKHYIEVRSLGASAVDRIGQKVQHRIFNHWFVGATKDRLDFIGLNFYTCHYARGLTRRVQSRPGSPVTQMGWEICPEGLTHALVDLGRYGLPLYVTENGIATDDDGQRKRYIEAHLGALEEARCAGVDVRGYFYWSIWDNFEWAEGFDRHFGLMACDPATGEKKARESAYWFGRLSKSYAARRSG